MESCAVGLGNWLWQMHSVFVGVSFHEPGQPGNQRTFIADNDDFAVNQFSDIFKGTVFMLK